jgi:hypothetical protein
MMIIIMMMIEIKLNHQHLNGNERNQVARQDTLNLIDIFYFLLI